MKRPELNDPKKCFRLLLAYAAVIVLILIALIIVELKILYHDC
jgi:hypothetical protein